MAKAQNAVAVQAASAIALATAMPEWLQKGNRGSENVDASDLILPRLGQIQALSPQIKKNDPAFIEGAEQGQLFNPLTGEIYGENVTFIPVLFRKEWVVFKDRKAGGGFFGAFASEQESLKFIDGHEDRAKLESIESHNHIGYVVKGDGSRDQIVFTCTKSKIKASRKLNSLVAMTGVDRFATAYQIRSVEAQNGAGDEFWSVDVSKLGFVTQDLYAEMATTYETLKDKTIKTSYDDEKSNESKGSAADEREF